MERLIGHHTCSNTGDFETIVQQGIPSAIATYAHENDKNPFLGSGYYFWDDNIGTARYWGRTHYNNNYYIFQATIPYNDEMLDLVGNRQHMQFIVDLMYRFRAENNGVVQWDLGTFIEFLKDISTEDEFEGIFPFTSIRAIDHSATRPEVEYFFDAESRNFIILNPRIIVCVIKANTNTIQNLFLKEQHNG